MGGIGGDAGVGGRKCEGHGRREGRLVKVIWMEGAIYWSDGSTRELKWEAYGLLFVVGGEYSPTALPWTLLS